VNPFIGGFVVNFSINSAKLIEKLQDSLQIEGFMPIIKQFELELAFSYFNLLLKLLEYFYLKHIELVVFKQELISLPLTSTVTVTTTITS